jgi:leukotriene-A4 hydrolase
MALITDPNTLSNHHKLVTEHTTIKLALDFETSTVSGDVLLELKALEDGIEEVVLDTSYLEIKNAFVDAKETSFSLKSRKEPYGSALHIPLAEAPKKDTTIVVAVRWSTF